MDIFKIVGIGFLTLIITMVLKECKKEYAIYSSLIGGAIILFVSMDTLKTIIDFIEDLSIQGYNYEFMKLLLKVTGIAILTEYAVNICKDTGENSIANKIDFGAKIVIISLSIPVISTSLETLTRKLAGSLLMESLLNMSWAVPHFTTHPQFQYSTRQI